MKDEQLNQFPESIRDWDEIKNSESPEVFWDRMGNLRSKIGTGLYQPGEDAGDEDWSKFTSRAVELSDNRLIPRPDLEDDESRTALYRTLGMPEEASGYEFAEMEGTESNEDYQNLVRQAAHKAGLTKNQLKYMDETLTKASVEANTQAEMQMHEDLSKLKQDWGLAFDERVHQANKVVEAFFPQLKGAQLAAGDIAAFHAIAKQLGGNSTEFKEQGNQPSAVMTPNDAMLAISEIRNNKAHPYNNSSDPGYKAAKLKVRNLYLIKNGQQPE